MNRSLSRMSARQLEKVLKAKQREEKAAPLVKKRAALLKAAEKLEKKIARIVGSGAATSTRSRRRGRKGKRGPGRPPKTGRRGRPPKATRRGRPPKKGKARRPVKKVRKLSAAGRARIRAAVKARWAKVRAKKAKMANRAKTIPKKVEAPSQESQATT